MIVETVAYSGKLTARSKERITRTQALIAESKEMLQTNNQNNARRKQLRLLALVSASGADPRQGKIPASKINGSVFNSWKDIAAHLRTSVRTAQRWEVHCHLPVHRPSGSSKGPVFAMKKELDEWIQSDPLKAGNGSNGFIGLLPRKSHAEVGQQILTPVQRTERMHGLVSQIKFKTEALQRLVQRSISPLRPKS